MIFYVILLLSLFSCTQNTVKPPPRPFSLDEISTELPPHGEVQLRMQTEEERVCVGEALAQKYHYFGCGGQCHTFFSEDGQYVLKFIKQRPFALSKWTQMFPLIKNEKMRRKVKKRDGVFSAFELAFNQIPSETGMLYIHLNQTQHLKKEIQLICPQDIAYTIALDEVEFIVQRRAQLAYDRIDMLMSVQDEAGAKEAIQSLLILHSDLYKRRFRNRDANFESNCGFIGNMPIVFDVGRFVQVKDSLNLKKEMRKITPRFRAWLGGRYPQLLPTFDETVVKILSSDT